VETLNIMARCLRENKRKWGFKMKLLLNEVLEAEQIISGDKLSVKPFEALSLLARYYRQIKELSPKETREHLYSWLGGQLGTHSDDWNEFIEKVVANSKKYPLLQIEKISITKSEMNKIQSLKRKNQQKLAFVLLVYAKYGNAKSSKNNSWVLTQQYKVFQTARVVGDSRWTSMKELRDAGLIEFAHKVDNINVRVLFIDDKSDIELEITDLRELGYQYLRYIGEDFIECQECGVLVRKTVHNKRYCKGCAGYQPIKTKKIQCCDCNEWFEVESSSRNRTRCDYCQSIKVKEDTRKRVNKMRNTGNCNGVH